MKKNDPGAQSEWVAEAARFLNSHLEVLRGLQISAAERAQKYLLVTNAGAVVAMLSYIGTSQPARPDESVWFALGCFVSGVVLCGVLVAVNYHGTTHALNSWVRDTDRFFSNDLDLTEVTANLRAGAKKWGWAPPAAGYLAFMALVMGCATAIHTIAATSRPTATTSAPPPLTASTNAVSARPATFETGWWHKVTTDPNASFAGFVAAFTLALVIVGWIQATHLNRTVVATRDAASLSRQAVQRQSFDTAFFQLLQRFNEMVSSLNITEWSLTGPGLQGAQSRHTKGRKAIELIYEEMKSRYPVGKIDDVLGAIVEMHHAIYLKYEPELGPYFRTLYHVFKFVHRAEFLTEQEKIDYANIARAQLSRFELALMFYNCLTNFGTKFKPLVETYGILKHVNEADLADVRHKTDPHLYRRTAFMSQDERERFGPRPEGHRTAVHPRQGDPQSHDTIDD